MMPTVGKFCTPGEAHRLELVEEHVHQAERVGAVDAGKHRRVLDHGQHLGRHLDHDLVGVAVGQQPRERAAAGHAVAPGVVDHDEVDAAGLLALGGQAGAGAAADDGLAAGDHGLELVERGRIARSAAWLSVPPLCGAAAGRCRGARGRPPPGRRRTADR